LTSYVLHASDVVVLLGCTDECTVVPGRRYEDWPVPDPAGGTPEQIAAILADLDGRGHELLVSLLPGQTLPAPVTGS
jgi:arsenate reductase (thioredoxin)